MCTGSYRRAILFGSICGIRRCCAKGCHLYQLSRAVEELNCKDQKGVLFFGAAKPLLRHRLMVLRSRRREASRLAFVLQIIGRYDACWRVRLRKNETKNALEARPVEHKRLSGVPLSSAVQRVGGYVGGATVPSLSTAIAGRSSSPRIQFANARSRPRRTWVAGIAIVWPT